MRSVVVLGGGNVGDVTQTLNRAERLIAEHIGEIISRSTDHTSEAWGFESSSLFTNRAWVFTDADRNKPIYKQLPVFAGGRLLTFFLDYLITYFGALALSKLLPALNSQSLFGREWNINEIAAKLAAAVVVIIVNYFISKLLVFTKKQPRGE